ncbi:MAG: PAS domain-containing protein, partial [Alphaproteobacteria bacterium]|nr:PAS domain-containing protein [Alphaproteobacteria bacterium]
MSPAPKKSRRGENAGNWPFPFPLTAQGLARLFQAFFARRGSIGRNNRGESRSGLNSLGLRRWQVPRHTGTVVSRGRVDMSEGSSDAQRNVTFMTGIEWRPDAMLHLLPTAACICDGAGRIVHFNPKAADLWGGEPAMGAGLAETWSAPSGVDRILRALRSGDELAGAVLAVESGTGAGRCFLVNARRLPGGGEPGYAIITFQSWPGAGPASDERVRALFEAMPLAVYLTDAEGYLTFYNQAAADLWGYAPAIGTARWCGSWKIYYADGRLMAVDACPMAQTLRERRPVRNQEVVIETPGGARTAVMPYPTPLFDDSGTFVGAINALVDITHEKLADERHTLFSRELNHRVKNALATGYAIARQTQRYTEAADEFRESFGARLLALSRAHDLLVHSQWQETSLRSIVGDALSAYSGGRVRMEGEDILFGPRATLTLAMTFHELVSNAASYGALSAPAGRIQLAWHCWNDDEGERTVELMWEEQDGPPVEGPGEPGFGTRL